MGKENNFFEEMIETRVETLWENNFDYGKEERQYVTPIIEVFNKLRDFIGEGEARKWLFELDSLHTSISAERERSMYRQGLMDGMRLIKNV